ncbi:imidazole glycerol phosphate synthase subunit HisF [Amnibacterium soli]
MMLATRVIPCLDVAAGRVVKGVRFQGLEDAGDPVELAARYADGGADEVTFLDVTATVEARGTLLDTVRRTAEQVFVPLTVGGGVRSVEDVDRLLQSGADKIGVNSAAIARPELIAEIAERFGSQVCVLSLDVLHDPRSPSGWSVTTHGGRTNTGIDALDWTRRAIGLGAGELLLNSIDADGTKAGYDLRLIEAVRAVSPVPLIASGGAGSLEHFAPAVQAGADAVLAASVFHRGVLTIGQVKAALADAGVTVRQAAAR